MVEAQAAPSLVSLCLKIVADELIIGDVDDDFPRALYKLPDELLDSLLPRLTPLALELLQRNMPLYGPQDDNSRTTRKRKRWLNFEMTWKKLYEKRWPQSSTQDHRSNWLTGKSEVKDEVINDWMQLYWETHLQKCVDAAAEIAALPSFNGSVGLIATPAPLLKCIGIFELRRDLLYSKFSDQCQHFGSYARCLRLSSSLCVPEICDLLRNTKLESLQIQWIKSKQQVDGICALLKQNCETLKSVEFNHCKLSARYFSQMCDSLWIKDLNAHGIQNFSIKLSSFLESSSTLPVGLTSFIASGRSLSSLSLCADRLQQDSVKMVIETLLDASSNIVDLDLSDNFSSGCLSHFKPSTNSKQMSSGIGKSLQSLRALNLRDNNIRRDDAESLKYVLAHMPKLETLDLSDNPIEDGIVSMIAYFTEMPERTYTLANLKLGNCELTFNGVSKLLETLSTWKKPLRSLSLRENHLGRKMGTLLGKFLQKGIRSLDIDNIGLEPLGFQEAQEQIMGNLELVYISIRKNRGRRETAQFLSKLISCAPELVAIDARHNLIPVESLLIISSTLDAMKGKCKLERLDLTGDVSQIFAPDGLVLAGLQNNGKCIVKLDGRISIGPYDNDP